MGTRGDWQVNETIRSDRPAIWQTCSDRAEG
nr:MAG TPA: hypothetical protein [Caudoviricetes sp.]